MTGKQPEDNEALLVEVRQVLERLHLQPLCQILDIDETRLAAQVKTWQGNPPETTPAHLKPNAGDLVFREVSRLLYEACQKPGEERGNSAYEWLWAYLLRVLLHWLNHQEEVAKDLTGNTLIKITQKLPTCKSPYSFLTWAKQIAYREFLMYQRANSNASATIRLSETAKNSSATAASPTVTPEVDSSEDGDASGKKTPPKYRFYPLDTPQAQNLEAGPSYDPLRQALTREQYNQLLECIKQIKRGKRASNYRKILIETLIFGTRLEDLTHELGLPLQEIRRQQVEARERLINNRECIDRLRDKA